MEKSSNLTKSNHFKQYFLLFKELLSGGKFKVSCKVSWKNISIFLSMIVFLFSPLLIFETLNKAKAELDLLVFNKLSSEELKEDFILEFEKSQDRERNLVFLQENSLWPVSHPFFISDTKVTQKINVVVTAYSSTPWETYGDPYITAAGTVVRDGIVANNFLPFGTKIRIPEIFGNKVFVVEDRMHWRKGNYHIDIWFPSYWQALHFGVKRTYIEILGV